MKTQNKKITQIILGILTALVLWGSGILLSGRIVTGDTISLYRAGALTIIFPFIFLGACILIAKYSANKNMPEYYKTSIICFILPFIAWIICLLLNSIAQVTTPIFSYIANYISLIFTVPLISVYQQLLSLIPTGTDGAILVLLSIAYFIPMVVGVLISLKVYKKLKK
ncbi:MAG: hypothetical protein IJN94_05865 [Clostridia bacterium]|nr:hypothetical protein [Clostridia bacterium]